MAAPDISRRRLLQAAATGATAGIAGCTTLAGGPDPEPIPDATPGGADWPTGGYDARNARYNADASPPRSLPTPRWHREFRFCYRPVVRGDRVVLNAGDHTVGLRATDGERVWTSQSEPWGYPTPTLGANRAYVTGPDCVFGIDLDTGEESWHGQPCHGANTASGTLANGRLYLAYGGYFSALDATGRVTWASRHSVQASPAVAADTAYVATAFTAEAVDLTASATEWPWEDSDDDEPAHATRRAATDWSVPPDARIAGPRVYRSPAVSGATVFVTVEFEDDPGGELRALTRDTGEERWAVASPPDRRPGEQSRDAPDPVARPVAPVVTDDRVVTALGDRRIRALTHGGDVDWTRRLDRVVTELAGGGDTLLAVTHDRTVESTAPRHATLTAVDLDSGETHWELTFADHVAGVAVAGETVYVTAITERQADGDVGAERLLAFDATDQ